MDITAESKSNPDFLVMFLSSRTGTSEWSNPGSKLGSFAHWMVEAKVGGRVFDVDENGPHTPDGSGKRHFCSPSSGTYWELAPRLSAQTPDKPPALIRLSAIISSCTATASLDWTSLINLDLLPLTGAVRDRCAIEDR